MVNHKAGAEPDATPVDAEDRRGASGRSAARADPTEGDASPGWGRWRAEFPIFERAAYLNSNSLGALSRRSVARRREFERQWNELGASAWYDPWMSALEEVRAGFGRTVGARPEDVALMPSVSAALAAVAGAVDWSTRNRVVLTSLDFPTLGHQFLSRRRLGVEVRIVESPDGVQVPPEAIARAVDDRTALVATSHVYFATGAVQDVGAVAEIAHRAGALFLLDAYQATGQLPTDVHELGVDFLASGALKWLCGGPGAAFLYVRPELDLQPTTLSWFGVEDQFSFDLRPARPRADARRFELGTPATGAAYTALGGLEVIEQVGIPRIRERNRELAADLVERLRQAGLSPRLPKPESRSALILVPHPDAAGAVRHLAGRGVIADHRTGCVRLSPHFYNLPEDNERAAAALRSYGPGGPERT